MGKKEKSKVDFSIVWVLLLALFAGALMIGGLIIVLRNLFIPELDDMFEGIMYCATGIIMTMVMAIMVSYQKTISLMNDYIEQANILVEKSQTIPPQQAFPTTVFMGGMPNSISPEEMEEYRKMRLKGMGYQNKLAEMSNEELTQELKKAEQEDNFERAVEIRDEIKRRKDTKS